MHAEPRAVISGMGAVCAAGVGCSALRRATLAGSSALRPWSRRPSSSIPLGLAPGGARYLDTRTSSREDQARCVELAIAAAREALEHASLHDRAARADVALVLGTNLGDRPAPLHELAAAIADALGLGGPRLVVMLACASSTAALGVAHRVLADGDVPAAVVGGADLTTPLVLAGFQTLGLLAASSCTPFGPAVGTSLAEGAGFVVLEAEPHARARARHPRFVITGHGLAADAYHPTRPHPHGLGTARSILSALGQARREPSEVEHVNVHGTGTEANDLAEWRGLRRSFGDHARTLWVSASKGMLGHAQGASGILELLTTVLAWEHGMIPVTHATVGLRPGCEGVRLAVGSPQPTQGTVALICNSGFGGLNAATVLERIVDDAAQPPSARASLPGRIAIAGHAALDGADRIIEGLCPTRAVSLGDSGRALRGIDHESMDTTTRRLCLATRLALLDAGVDLRRSARERTGLFAAIHEASPARVRALERCIDERGVERMSATCFVQALVTTPLGASTEALGLRGPVELLSAGRAGGLLAVVLAAGWLREHDDVDVIVAGSADEDDERDTWEGGVGVVLARPTSGCVPKGPGCVLLASHGIAGPACPEAAVARALARAGLPLDRIDATWGDAVAGHPGPRHALALGRAASTGTLAVAMAVAALERREVHHALVYVAQRGIGGIAVILTREDTHARC